MSTLAFLCPSLHQCRPRFRLRYPDSLRTRQHQRTQPLSTTIDADAAAPPSESSFQGRQRERRLLNALRSYGRKRTRSDLVPASPPRAFADPAPPSPSRALREDYFSTAILRPEALTKSFHYVRLEGALRNPYRGCDLKAMRQYTDRAWACYTSVCDAVGYRSLSPELHRRVLAGMVPQPGDSRTARVLGKSAWSEPQLRMLDHRVFTLLDRLRTIGAPPRTQEYNIALYAFRYTGRYESALVLLRDLRADGVTPDELTFRAVLESFFSRRKGIKRFVREGGEAAHIMPLLRGIMQDMAALGVPLSPLVLDRLARLLREMDAQAELDQLFRTHYGLDLRNPDRVAQEFLARAGPDAPLPGISTHALNTLLRVLSKKGDAWQALLAFEVLCHPLPGSAVSPHSALDLYPGFPRADKDARIRPGTSAFAEDEDDDLPWGNFMPLAATEHRQPLPIVSTYDALVACAYWANNPILCIHFLNCAISDEKRVHARAVDHLRATGEWVHPRVRLSYKAVWLTAARVQEKHQAPELRYLQNALQQLVNWRDELLDELVRVADGDLDLDVDMLKRFRSPRPSPDPGAAWGLAPRQVHTHSRATNGVALADKEGGRTYEDVWSREGIAPSRGVAYTPDGSLAPLAEPLRAVREGEPDESPLGATIRESAFDRERPPAFSSVVRDDRRTRLRNPFLSARMRAREADPKARLLAAHINVMMRENRDLQYFLDVHLPRIVRNVDMYNLRQIDLLARRRGTKALRGMMSALKGKVSGLEGEEDELDDEPADTNLLPRLPGSTFQNPNKATS
ncbi:hypothetical protein CALVIDRAFT_540216 [Calocera viscosa TUFC12733]|uniref:Pentatricopeptide repeat-containing protein n=1 Tax=Calocera viscosa (strain TUFC12733) TaxID=1330018 RepID=A0A167J3W3_CALVF|nr:hypothetical protein CALVIDRAFT_540216 [Calocera viscosa TUFC12733]